MNCFHGQRFDADAVVKYSLDVHKHFVWNMFSLFPHIKNGNINKIRDFVVFLETQLIFT